MINTTGPDFFVGPLGDLYSQVPLLIHILEVPVSGQANISSADSLGDQSPATVMYKAIA